MSVTSEIMLSTIINTLGPRSQRDNIGTSFRAASIDPPVSHGKDE
jgi:hypothetical protein